MIAVLWAYEGWQFGTYNAGEVIAPQKSFPRAFLLGSLILIVLYLFAVIAYMIALGPAAASVSDAIAADAVRLVLGRWAGKIIAFTILISTFSATNSVILTAPRVFYAMANDRLFFQNFCSVHKRYQTPAIAILALGAWSAILASLGGFAELAAGAIFIGWIFYGLAAAAIFPIRRASKNATLPYRVPGYPWTPGIFVLVAAAIVGNSIYVAIRDPGQFKSLVVAIVAFPARHTRLFPLDHVPQTLDSVTTTFPLNCSANRRFANGARLTRCRTEFLAMAASARRLHRRPRLPRRPL